MRHLEAFTGGHIERPAEGVNISLTQFDVSLTQLPPTLAALLQARSMCALGPQMNAARRRHLAEMAFASGPVRGLKFGAAATLRGATLCVGPIVWEEGEEEETHRCRAFVDRLGARVQRTIPPHVSQNSDFCVCAHRMDLCDDCLPPTLTCLRLLTRTPPCLLYALARAWPPAFLFTPSSSSSTRTARNRGAGQLAPGVRALRVRARATRASLGCGAQLAARAAPGAPRCHPRCALCDERFCEACVAAWLNIGSAAPPQRGPGGSGPPSAPRVREGHRDPSWQLSQPLERAGSSR